MITKNIVLLVLWILIAVIAMASLACVFFFPQYKLLAPFGAVLIFNLLLAVFLLKRNIKK
ncbi:MAG: hypothetical protein LBI15_08250 [Dysgonamonadaceae bacterium]|jgi:hypothetical protein|nr:hypothetical protein [Dysgonamonadaceae bacterium]